MQATDVFSKNWLVFDDATHIDYIIMKIVQSGNDKHRKSDLFSLFIQYI